MGRSWFETVRFETTYAPFATWRVHREAIAAEEEVAILKNGTRYLRKDRPSHRLYRVIECFEAQSSAVRHMPRL